MAKKAIERNPRDSWIRIEAGAEHVFDTQAVQQEQQKMQRYGREVRGTIIAVCSDIEWSLDVLLLMLYCPPSPQQELLRTAFRNQLLEGGKALRFERKIELLEEIGSPELGNPFAIPPLLIDDLNYIRSARNNFAHGGIALIPDGPEPIKSFKSRLYAGNKIVEISDKYIEELLRKCDASLQTIEELIRANEVENS